MGLKNGMWSFKLVFFPSNDQATVEYTNPLMLSDPLSAIIFYSSISPALNTKLLKWEDK